MVVNCKEFAYTTDAALQADMSAWFAQLRLAGTPVRDFKVNFIQTTRVLVTAVYGMSFAGGRQPTPEELYRVTLTGDPPTGGSDG